MRPHARPLQLLAIVLGMLVLPACGSEAEAPGHLKAINRAVLTYLTETQFQADSEDPAMLVVSPESRTFQKDDADWANNWAFVRGETQRGSSRPHLPGLRDDTCANFVKANEQSQDLSTSLDAPLPVVLLRSAEFSAFKMQGVVHEMAHESAGKWQRFHLRYPRAYAWIRLSSPGVSDDETQAVVYISMDRGSLDGWSGYCLLSRTADGWKATGLCITLVS